MVADLTHSTWLHPCPGVVLDGIEGLLDDWDVEAPRVLVPMPPLQIYFSNPTFQRRFEANTQDLLFPYFKPLRASIHLLDRFSSTL